MAWIKQSLGISLEEGSLRLVCLRGSWRGPHLVDRATFAFPPVREDAEGLAQEVQKFLLKNGIRNLDAITFGVPRADLFFRHISTPPVKERDLPDLVEFEYDRHLPGAREEFLVGYRNLGRSEDGGYRLLLCAARRDRLENYLTTLRLADLTPSSLQPIPMALAEAFRQGYPDVPAALLLSVGRESFTADFIEKGRMMLSRPFGLGLMPQQKARTPEGRAVEEEGEDFSPAPDRLAEALCGKITHPLFLEALPGGTLPPLWVQGPGDEGGSVAESIERRLAVPVRTFEPFLRISGSSSGKREGGSGASFGLALLGLGRGGDGLELSEERTERLREGPKYRTTAFLAVACLVLLAASFGIRALQSRTYLGEIEKEIVRLREHKVEVESLSRQVAEKQQRLDFLAGTIGGRVRQADLLKELTVLIPDDTYLSDYNFKKGTIEISGLSPSASRLLSILEASPLFKGARFSSTIVSQGKTHERFKIRLSLEEGSG